MGTTRARRIPAIVLLGGLLVAGCSGDPEPIYEEPADPPSGSAGSSGKPTTEPTTELPTEPPTPSPTEPVGPPRLPAAAEAPTRAGAEAFVRHYFDVLNYVQGAGDTAPLRRLATTGCDGCRAGTDGLDELFEQGGVYQGGVTTVESTEAMRIFVEGGEGPQLVDVRMRGRVTSSREVLPGKDPVVYEPGAISLRLVVSRAERDAWRVSLLEVTS